jgi:hypothetical protein
MKARRNLIEHDARCPEEDTATLLILPQTSSNNNRGSMRARCPHGAAGAPGCRGSRRSVIHQATATVVTPPESHPTSGKGISSHRHANSE